uniref:Neuropeptide S n=1 Tax=Heterorhabditis bacteriophora TaxID=37862 RepID=A0A1I7XQZ5_HETBA
MYLDSARESLEEEMEWIGPAKRRTNSRFTMGFGKRGLNKQFTMGFGKRLDNENEQGEFCYMFCNAKSNIRVHI